MFESDASPIGSPEAQSANQIIQALKSDIAIPDTKLGFDLLDARVGRPSRCPDKPNIITTPDIPHIYLVDQLILQLPNDRQLTLEDIVVLHGHAQRSPDTREWFFGHQPHQNVINIAWKFNQHAQKAHHPPIGFISGCSDTTRTIQKARLALSGQVVYDTITSTHAVIPTRAGWLPRVIFSPWGLHYSIVEVLPDNTLQMRAHPNFQQQAAYIKVIDPYRYQVLGEDNIRFFSQYRNQSGIIINPR